MATQKRIAQLLGVTPREVYNLVQKGMPATADGEKRKYDEADCVQWYVRYKVGEVERRQSSQPRDLEEARTRKTAAEAELAEIELAKARADVVPIAVHESRVAAICDRLAAALNQMPTKFAGAVVGAKDEASARAVLESARDFAFRATQAVADEIEDEPFTDDDQPAQEAA